MSQSFLYKLYLIHYFTLHDVIFPSLSEFFLMQHLKTYREIPQKEAITMYQ